MKALRLLAPAALAVALVPFVSGPASAAPPANDTPGGATAITLGQTVNQDTTQATTDADDATLNDACGAPATNASVWYTYTPASDGTVAFDASASSYTTGLMVFAGTPSADTFLGCGPDAVGADVTSGTTYYVMAFSDSDVIGGSLVLTLENAPTPRTHVTLSRNGLAFHGGAASLHGSYLCTHDESFSELDAHLLQRSGRLKIQADGSARIRCDGVRHRWSARLVSPNGYFAHGKAVGEASLISCGLVNCTVDSSKRAMHLSWSKHRDSTRSMRPTHVASSQRPQPLVHRSQRWPAHFSR